ncbi:MAG: hypothetical protein AB8F74_22795 [Saprospiraceae bacterium]
MKYLNAVYKAASILVVTMLFTTTACYDYEPQFEGEYEDAENGVIGEVKLPKELVIVAGGDVYLGDEFGLAMEAITSSGNITTASINDDKTKVLYKREGEEVSIYDITAQSEEGRVSGSINAKWFDYHPNSETIYFLTEDGILNTVGPEVLVQNPIDLKTHLNIVGNINPLGVVLLPQNGFVYTYYNSFGFSFGMIHSSGTNLIESTSMSSSKSILRINKSASVIHAVSSSAGDDVTIYRFPFLGFYGFLNDVKYAVPIDLDRSYSVTEDNIIDVPFGEDIPSPNGAITAIDF